MHKTTVGDLRKLLADEKISDDTLIVVPGADHSYRNGVVCTGPIDTYKDGQLDEAHGDAAPDGAKRVTALIIT
jgi:hypothetical protein